MKITVAEKIQILRKRAGLNQGTLGSKAFDTSYESGRTKIKNLELGKQNPTLSDLDAISKTLNVDRSEFTDSTPQKNVKAEGITISPKVVEVFPGIDVYIEMMNKAVSVNDIELIDYIAAKLSGILKRRAPGILTRKTAVASSAG